VKPNRLLLAATVLVSTTLALGLAEAGLRLFARPRKSTLPDYNDTWRKGGLGEGGFLKEGFEGELTDGFGGRIRWKNDAQGFRRDADVSPEPPAKVFRILSMGDSFTAGYRVDQEATFSRLLEKDLQRRGVPAEVLVSCVEEPVTGLDYLSRFGNRYHPRLVLLGLTLGNDIAQAYASLSPGGPYRLDARDGDAVVVEAPESERAKGDRFASLTLPPGCVRAGAAPGSRRNAPIRSLRLLDLVLGPPRLPINSTYEPGRLLDSNGLGMFLAKPPAVIEDAFAALFRALDGYRLFCEKRRIALAVLLFPQRYQVSRKDWIATREGYGLDETCFDLSLPNRRIREFCARSGIRLLDPTEAMARRREDLYLPLGDMHWSAKGHRAFFEAVSEPLATMVVKERDAR
jgi:hypothetical protein